MVESYLNYNNSDCSVFLLFAPSICNCVAGFVSSLMKAFKLQMVVQAPTSAIASSNYYLGNRSETLNMRVRRICWLNNLGTMPLNSRK